MHNMTYIYMCVYIYISVPLIRGGPPGYFIHISIITPIVSALKNFYDMNMSRAF